MQGKILDYNSEFKSGLIRGNDGNKYRFSIDDCKSSITPKVGVEVDFEPSGDKATEIYVLTKDTVDDIKNVASSAVGVVTTSIKTPNGIVKKIIIAIIGVIALWLIIGIIITLVDHYNRDETKKHISVLVSEGDALFQANDFQKAITKYQSAREIDPHSNLTYVPTGWKYDYKMAECYLAMNKPKKALSLIGSPISFKTYADITLSTNPSNLTVYIHYSQIEEMSKSRKAWMCRIASKAFSLENDQFSAKVYAHGACENGDCSLVEK